ncbi:MAG TPA: hypothetical protein VNJ51_02065 [Candidatus Dormibacteraeota bacterium]|nr:hypothetical protein [Candidatus Dormibacteraeota bacterium]
MGYDAREFKRGHASVAVGSRAGGYIVEHAAFVDFVLHLGDSELPLAASERNSLAMLAAVPHAFLDEEAVYGEGWRVVPPVAQSDWPVLETTPRRLREALETARTVLWRHAGPVGITAGDLIAVEGEIDAVLVCLQKAEAAGVSVNVTYVA